MPQRILALETPGDRVRGALAERTWNAIHLTGVFEEQRLPDETGLSQALKRLLERTGIPDIVVSALPGSKVLKRLLELPFNDNRRLNQVVPFALEEHVPFPVDDSVVAFAPLGRDGGNTLVIAAMARKSDLRAHLELLAEAGLDPKTVTLSELATANLLASHQASMPGAHLLLAIESANTSMVLVDSEGRPRALRSVNAGAVPATDGGVSAATDAGPILGAARQTLLAHSSEVQDPDVIVVGSGAESAALRREIAEGLAVPMRDAQEFSAASMLNGQAPEMSRYAGCIAMLLGEAPNAKTQVVNFRQSEFTFRGRVRGDLTPFYTSAILAAVVVALVIVNFVLGLSTNLGRLHELDRSIATIAEPALGPNPPDDAVEALRTKITALDKRLTLMGGGEADSSPLNALLAISRELPKRFPVEMSDVTINSSGVRLTGEADSFATVDEMKNALARGHEFGAIDVIHAKATNDGKVDFQLRLSFKDAVAGSG